MEEIFLDSFIEALSENIVEMVGGTEALGFWISSIATSIRESSGPLADLSYGDIESIIRQYVMQDVSSDLASQLQTIVEQDQASQTARETAQKKLLGSLAVKGIVIIAGSLLAGGFNFFSLTGIMNMIGGGLDTQTDILESKLKRRTILQNVRIGRVQPTEDVLEGEDINLETVQLSEIEDFITQYKDRNNDDMTIVSSIPNVTPDPRNYDSQRELAIKFIEIQLVSYATELGIGKSALVNILRDQIKFNTGRIKGALILSKSMDPVLPAGRVVAVDSDFSILSPGDIIVVQKEGMSMPYAHVIIERFETLNGENKYRTKGINNPFPDLGTIGDANILGKVVEVSQETMKLIEYLSERGIVPIYDVLGMPNEFDINILDISNIDGKAFAQYVKKVIFEHESEIVKHLMNNEFTFRQDMRYGNQLYDLIIYEIRYENGKDVSIMKFDTSVEEIIIQRFVIDVEEFIIASLLGIHPNTYNNWLNDKSNPIPRTFRDIYEYVEHYFGGLTLAEEDLGFSTLLLGRSPAERRKAMIIEQMKAVLVDGVTMQDKPYKSRVLYKNFLWKDVPKKIQNEIKNLFDNYVDKGADLDVLLGTQNEGKDGKGLFEILLKEYNTKNKKARLIEAIYYLVFGDGQSNYNYIKNIIDAQGTYKLLTSHDEFIKMLVRKRIAEKSGLTIAEDLYLAVECLEKGHTHYIRPFNLYRNRGCPHCNNWKNEKITISMVASLFDLAKQDPNIDIKEFKIHKLYQHVLGRDFIEQHSDYNPEWRAYQWTLDVEIVVEIYGEIFEIGFESDGEQHGENEDGFESWLGLSKEIKKLDKITDKEAYDLLRADLKVDWRNDIIKKDKFKDLLYELRKSEGKILIRVPTWSEEASWDKRMGYIIDYLKEEWGIELGVDLSRFDGIDEQAWIDMFDNLPDLLGSDDSENSENQ